MALLLDGEDTNGTGDWVSMSGPATIYATGTFAGAIIQIEIASPTGAEIPVALLKPKLPYFFQPDLAVVDPVGAYRLRAVLSNAIPGTTNVTVEEVQA